MACTFTVRYLAILIIVALFLSCALAEAQEAPFRWRFSEDDSLFACAFTRVKISGGQGPFYMMAVDIDSAATVHRLEERADDEWVWKINHLSGAKLLLSVIDATGASGGVAPEPLTVQQGELACSSSITTISGLAVTVDVTDTSIGRCDSPVVNVLGGTPPYTFTILEQGAHAHNITADRAPDFAKHVAPHSSIFVVASDSKGRWSERPLRLTSPSTSCAEMPPSMQTILKRSSTQLATLPIILGAVIGFVIFLVLASATLGICWVVRRRRRRGMCTNALCFASQHSALPPQDISSAMISRGDEVRQYTVTKARNVVVDLAESPPSLTPLTLPQPDLDLDCSPPVNIVDGVLQPHLSTLSSTSVGESQAAHPYAAPGLSRASTSSLALSIASGDISSPLPFPSPAMPTPALIAPSQAPSSRLFPNEKRALRAAQHHRATSASCARKRTRHGSLPGPSGLRHSANEISGLPSSSSHQLDRQREMVCNWERRQPAMDKAFRPALYLSSSSSSPSRAPIPPIATNLSPVRPLPLPPLSAPAQTAIPPRRIHDQNGAQRAREPRLRHMHSAGDVHAIIRARQREALRQELEQQAHQHEVVRHLSMMQRVPEHGLVAVGENSSPETISLSPPPPYSELMLARIMSAP